MLVLAEKIDLCGLLLVFALIIDLFDVGENAKTVFK